MILFHFFNNFILGDTKTTGALFTQKSISKHGLVTSRIPFRIAGYIFQVPLHNEVEKMIELFKGFTFYGCRSTHVLLKVLESYDSTASISVAFFRNDQVMGSIIYFPFATSGEREYAMGADSLHFFDSTIQKLPWQVPIKKEILMNKTTTLSTFKERLLSSGYPIRELEGSPSSLAYEFLRSGPAAFVSDRQSTYLLGECFSLRSLFL
jgi:hypothetical protein